jgi:hypothetical protein
MHLLLTAALFPTASSMPVISLFFILSYPRILGFCSSEWPLSSGFCDEFTFILCCFLYHPHLIWSFVAETFSFFSNRH